MAVARTVQDLSPARLQDILRQSLARPGLQVAGTAGRLARLCSALSAGAGGEQPGRARRHQRPVRLRPGEADRHCGGRERYKDCKSGGQGGSPVSRSLDQCNFRDHSAIT